MEYRDYYATLGVPRTASKAEIKKAFRKLARQHHPDVNRADPGAERRFKEVNEAYAVVGDPEKRKAYDTLGANWEAYQQAGAGRPGAGPFAGSGGFPGFGGSAGGPTNVRFEYRGDAQDLAGFSEFFRTFFAGASPFGEQGPGRAGASGGPAPRTAPVAGRARVRTGRLGDLFADLDESPYPDDAGRSGGRVSGARSRAAPSLEAEADVTLEEVATGTTRHVEVDGQRIEVTIPAGVADGQRIRFSGVGASKSNVYLRVKVRPHPIFTPRGPDLHRELPITLGEALLGAEVPVETLSGRVLLRIPPETQNGRSFRLAGKGLPRFRGEGRGDLYVRTRVVLPTGLTPEARDAAERLVGMIDQPDPRRS